MFFFLVMTFKLRCFFFKYYLFLTANMSSPQQELNSSGNGDVHGTSTNDNPMSGVNNEDANERQDNNEDHDEAEENYMFQKKKR